MPTARRISENIYLHPGRYQQKVYTPKWDIFINYEGDEYITRERQKDGSYKWRKAYGYNLEAYNWYNKNWDEYVYMNPGSSSQIQKILGTRKKGFWGMCEWQEGCKKRNEDKKIKKLTDQWDKDMEPIKDPPKGFKDWWHRNGFDGKIISFIDRHAQQKDTARPVLAG